jgi:hypothetical protein
MCASKAAKFYRAADRCIEPVYCDRMSWDKTLSHEPPGYLTYQCDDTPVYFLLVQIEFHTVINFNNLNTAFISVR